MSEHFREEEFVLYYYGDAPDTEAASAHLAHCDQCRSAYQALQRVLNSVDSLPVPERAPDYEARVWQSIEGQLQLRRPWYRPSWRPVAMAMTLAALVTLSFFAGRGTQTARKPPVADAAQLQQRVLWVALGAHLERTRTLFVELAHAQPQDGHFDLRWEQASAEQLLAANRLYRQTAAQSGDAGVAGLLEELERVMVELAHSPASVPQRQLEELRQRIDERNLLFKLDVLRTNSLTAAPASESKI